MLLKLQQGAASSVGFFPECCINSNDKLSGARVNGKVKIPPVNSCWIMHAFSVSESAFDDTTIFLRENYTLKLGCDMYLSDLLSQMLVSM